MEVGIFAKTFSRLTLEATLDAVLRFDIRAVQFNFSSVGMETIPGSVDESLLRRIREALDLRAMRVATISGTFNLIDPDKERRRENLRRLGLMASACRVLSTTKIALSTGTRDEQDMWRGHPDNNTAEAWRELLDSIETALAFTEQEGVLLLVEPEPGNVMSDANRARQLLNEIKSPRLKILFDAANLLSGHSRVEQCEVLDEAFDLLGPDIALAHGKEWITDELIEVRVPGQGSLNWDYYLESLAHAGYAGPLILHGFDEAAVEDAVAFVRSKLIGSFDAQRPAEL